MKIQKKDILMFIIIFLFTLILFSRFLSVHYATDTYRIIDLGYEEYSIKWPLLDGRIFMYLIGLLLGFLNVHINTYIVFSLLSALFISCITVMVIKNIILKYKPAKNLCQEILLLVVAYFTIFNFMYLENMYFVDSITMALSILLYILASKSLVDKNKKYFFKSLILFILAIFSYQGTVAVFFTMTILLSLLKHKNDYRSIFKNVLECACISAIGVILNIIHVKVVSEIIGEAQVRIKGITSIPSNITFILSCMSYIFMNTCSLYPMFLFEVLLICIIVLILKFALKSEEPKKIIYQFILFFLTLFSSFIPFIITVSSIMAGRMHFTIGAFIGLLYILLYCNTEIFNDKIKKALISIFAIYAITTIGIYIYIIEEHKIVNELDIIAIQEIDNYISNYEKESGNKVDKIHVYTVVGDQGKAQYEQTIFKGVLTDSALKANWSIIGAINFHTDRNLKRDSEGQDPISKSAAETIEGEYVCIENTFYIKAYVY